VQQINQFKSRTPFDADMMPSCHLSCYHSPVCATASWMRVGLRLDISLSLTATELPHLAFALGSSKSLSSHNTGRSTIIVRGGYRSQVLPSRSCQHVLSDQSLIPSFSEYPLTLAVHRSHPGYMMQVDAAEGSSEFVGRSAKSSVPVYQARSLTYKS